jgi:hypothetical protein
MIWNKWNTLCTQSCNVPEKILLTYNNWQAQSTELLNFLVDSPFLLSDVLYSSSKLSFPNFTTYYQPSIICIGLRMEGFMPKWVQYVSPVRTENYIGVCRLDKINKNCWSLIYTPGSSAANLMVLQCWWIQSRCTCACMHFLYDKYNFIINQFTLYLLLYNVPSLEKKVLDMPPRRLSWGLITFFAGQVGDVLWA